MENIEIDVGTVGIVHYSIFLVHCEIVLHA
jgi:hypothetical protein